MCFGVGIFTDPEIVNDLIVKGLYVAFNVCQSAASVQDAGIY